MRISDWSSDVCSSDFNLFSSKGYQHSERINNASETNRFLLQDGNNEMNSSGYRGQFGIDYDIDTTSNIATSIRFNDFGRSEARSVGKECVSRCRSGWSLFH